MKQSTKAKNIATIVFHGVWIVAAVFLWVGGLLEFLEHKGFGYWMLWGAFCAITIIVPIVRMTIQSAKDGAKQGAETFTAKRVGNTIYVENHPFKGILMGIVLGLFMSLLLGPILVPGYFVASVLTIITASISLAKGK